MVCTANDLQSWKDFPKGLRVLLLDGDTNSAADIRTKLEAMDYIVSIFCNENEALSAISSKPEGFHVAIVEVNMSNNQGCFKFLENAKDLPTIMTSNDHCLSTMMKCIALGAVEFLSKPLSEEKLRNIWQHVVHKAFNAGETVLSESLKPVKESVVSMLQLQRDNKEHQSKITIDLEKISRYSENDNELSAGSDNKYPAPSTPQLKQGARLLDDGDCHEQTHCLTGKESGELDGETKSVETTCGNSNSEGATPQPSKLEMTLIKKEEDFANGSKSESDISPNNHDGNFVSSNDDSTASPNKVDVHSDTCEITANKKKSKKMKVDWTPELHNKFVQAVEQLGIDQAIPSRILELMRVENLTRHNVASHLQKYRMHKRHILPKEEDRRWSNQRDIVQGNYYVPRPIMAFPQYHANHTLSPAPLYPIWGQPGGQPAGVQMWGPSNYHLWQPFPGMHAEAWGCPVLPPSQNLCFSHTQHLPGLHNANNVEYNSSMPPSSLEHHPADEVVDKVVKEAISKPWLPLPLGLKPPSTDSVLAELSRQGISTIPHGSKFI
ncbi:two-component response regulator-like APRR2 isoform X2 [Prosopis cineraria]|uniref:two-component response regulator-like APRR2 isoform X2 n=1 Tax=Prosopis cineraria TaxID=364024 RepID=UPI00241055C4|nr:two-component response regulator-like APRR2 isoform X2 [Prosopis cineraria]